MLYAIAALAGLSLGMVIVADRTLTEVAKDQKLYPWMPPGSSPRKRYIECMGLGVIVMLASGIYLYVHAGDGSLLQYAVLVPVALFSYHFFGYVDAAVKARYEPVRTST
jgi:hypothetical protein